MVDSSEYRVRMVRTTSLVGTLRAGCVLALTNALVCAAMHGQAAPAAPAAQPVTPQAITLNEAIARARANEPTFAAAMASAKNAKLDQSIARKALLPNAKAENQFLYTQGGAGFVSPAVHAQDPSLTTSSQQRFIAKNSVHE